MASSRPYRTSTPLAVRRFALVFLSLVLFAALSTLFAQAPPPHVITTAAGGGIGDGGLGVNSYLIGVRDVAIDSKGNMYISEASRHRIRRVDGATGVITTFVGTGESGYSGDGGPAKDAKIYEPDMLAVDAQDNLYFIDQDNSRVRKVDVNNTTITTVWEEGGYALAVDSDSNLYLGRRAVRKRSPGGEVSTLTVNGASFDSIRGIDADAEGNLYVGDSYFHTVHRITPAGDATLLLKSGSVKDFTRPLDVDVDASGNVYVSHLYHSVVRVNASGGGASIVAGRGDTSGVYNNNHPATSVLLPYPQGVATDASGRVYVTVNSQVWRFTPGGEANIVAGLGMGDRSLAVNAALEGPHGIGFDPFDNMYVIDKDVDRIRKVAPNGRISTVAGDRAKYDDTDDLEKGDGGPAREARFGQLQSVVSDLKGNLFITQGQSPYSGQRSIRKINACSGYISTVAGGSDGGNNPGNGGPATSADLGYVNDVAVDAAGNLYIAESNQIRKVDAKTKVISVLAGTGISSITTINDNGPALDAVFYSIHGIALDPQGNLIIADTLHQRIRKIDSGPDGILSPEDTITSIAGTGGISSSDGGYDGDDKPAAEARVNNPMDVAVDSAGNIFIADSGNRRIRKIAAGSGIITTVAGGGNDQINGQPDKRDGDGGPALEASIGAVQGIAIDRDGNLYLSELSSRSGYSLTPRVRKVAGVAAPGLIAGQPFPIFPRANRPFPPAPENPNVPEKNPLLGIRNGSFDGSFTGWITGGVNGGGVILVEEGEDFASSALCSDEIPFPEGGYAANVRSNGAGDSSSMGVLTSDPFLPNAPVLTFKTLSETTDANAELLLLKASANVMNPAAADILYRVPLVKPQPGTGPKARFVEQTVGLASVYNAADPSQGTPIRVQIRQRTTEGGKAPFTLVTDFYAGPLEPPKPKLSELTVPPGPYYPNRSMSVVVKAAPNPPVASAKASFAEGGAEFNMGNLGDIWAAAVKIPNKKIGTATLQVTARTAPSELGTSGETTLTRELPVTTDLGMTVTEFTPGPSYYIGQELNLTVTAAAPSPYVEEVTAEFVETGSTFKLGVAADKTTWNGIFKIPENATGHLTLKITARSTAFDDGSRETATETRAIPIPFSSVNVRDENNNPVADAEVYVNGKKQSSLTNAQGSVGLNAFLKKGDVVTARKRVYENPSTRARHNFDSGQNWNYRAYITSITVNTDGTLDQHVVQNPLDLQQLTVRKNNALLGFNLLASVRWDASASEMDAIKSRLERASQYIYNATDGQMFFERVELMDDTRGWRDADFQIYADRNLRANADMDGIANNPKVTGWRTYMRLARNDDADVYAHEFGHYALNLNDEYQDNKPGVRCTLKAQNDGSIYGHSEGPGNPTRPGSHASCMMWHQWRTGKLCSHHPDNPHNPDTRQGSRSCWTTVFNKFNSKEDRYDIQTPTTRDAIVGRIAGIPVSDWANRVISDNKVEPNLRGPFDVTFTYRSRTGEVKPIKFAKVYHEWGGSMLLGRTDENGVIPVVGAHTGEFIRIASVLAKISYKVQATDGGDASFTSPGPLPLQSSPTGIVVEGEEAPFALEATLEPLADAAQARVRVKASAALKEPPTVLFEEPEREPQVVAMTLDDSSGTYVGTVTGLEGGASGIVDVTATDTADQTMRTFESVSLSPITADQERDFFSNDGQLSMTLPAGSLSSGTIVGIGPMMGTPPALPEGYDYASGPYQILTSAESSLATPGVLRFQLPHQVDGPGVNGWDPSTLEIKRYDVETQTWVALESVFLPDVEIVTTSIDRLGTYALVGKTAPRVIRPRGDVNNDTTVNVIDAVLALRYSVGLEELTVNAFEAADMNDDYAVNVVDVIRILRIVAGLPD